MIETLTSATRLLNLLVKYRRQANSNKVKEQIESYASGPWVALSAVTLDESDPFASEIAE